MATVTQKEDLDFLNQYAGLELPDVLEFRLDNLLNHLDLVENTLEVIPVEVLSLITARCPEEGGAGGLSALERIGMYRPFLGRCDLIDTEVRSLRDDNFRDSFSSTTAKIVGSFHDFDKFPERGMLFETVEEAYESGADIAKVAVVVTTFSELNTLVELVGTQIEKGRAVSAMGMGPLGRLSRLVLAKAGSCLNYGYLQKENAPGQWSAQQLTELIREL